MAASISYDDSLWPLLISRFEPHLQDAAFAEYLQGAAFYLQREEPYICVFDLSRATLPSAAQRQFQMEWLRRNGPLMRRWVMGCAFVITSPIIRITLSTVLHIVPMPVPYVVVSDLERAVGWAASQFTDSGHLEAAARIHGRFPPASSG